MGRGGWKHFLIHDALCMMQDTHFSFLISFSVTSMSMWTLMPIFCFNLNFILISYSGTSFFISIFYSITLFNSMFVLCRGSNVYTHANILSNFYIIFNLIFHYFILYFYFSIQKLYFFLFLYCVDNCNADTHADILI